MTTKLVCRAILMSLIAGCATMQTQAAEPAVAHSAAKAQSAETPAQRDARMAWWREARFGMFVHWGLYAVPAGEWNGRKDLAEWFMDETGISREQYEKFAAQFNPTKYDPDEWVRIAKDAGMKYIVITSKHHEGFAMWDTQGTDYNIARRTPYAKGALKPLADAARRAGLHFGTYYSIMDWHDPSQSPAQPGKHYNPTKMDPLRKRAYIEEMKTELAELIRETHTEVLWFDGEWVDWWTDEDGRELYAYLHRLDPNLIVNSRIGHTRNDGDGENKGKSLGDFGTPEQNIPARGLGPGRYWETCMTLNDHWGYNKNDDHWKSPELVVRNLVDIASKGGNYLLNVGPDATGTIPAPAVAILGDVGNWLKINGESIYGTGGTPFDDEHGGYSTSEKTVGANKPKWIPKWDWRATSKSGKVYVHLFEWPGRNFRIDAGDVRVKSAYLLADPTHAPLAFSQHGKTLEVQLPQEPLDPIDTVLVLDTGA
ncbi:MAG: alpha-L-fucosidase [Rudaea sp.]|uniref:alpha-L-fucosidase n=1 Tax=Rudaea sp. TaxID=2136325 RepID=UPI0039E46CF3